MKSLPILLAVLAASAYCQTAAFEVASITPCPPGTPEPLSEHTGVANFTGPGGRFTAQAISVKFLLEWAYGILPVQHSEGPAWLGTDRYDIFAKAPGSATDAEMKLMTRALLDERFHLKFHKETQEVPVLILSVGKTAPKLYPPKDGEVNSMRMEPVMGPDKKPLAWHVVATRFSFEQLNQAFARQLGRVIVNRTGLEGDFDFAMDLTPDESQPNPMDSTMFIRAMRDQLGLALKTEKAPVEFFVIDSAQKVAAGNQ
jgi:uncharacterized protein (TIGR03435 family)